MFSREQRKYLKQEIQKLILVQREKDIPHICFYCGWFTMRKEKPRNRGCHYLGKIKVVGGPKGICQMWKLEPDPMKRRRVFFY